MTYGPDFAFCPLSNLPFLLCSNLTFSSLNFSTASSSYSNLGLGFCWGCRQGGWERGREWKRGAPATLIGVWDFVGDVDGAGERGGFERQRISRWWRWKLWEEYNKEMQERRRRFLKGGRRSQSGKKNFAWCTVEVNILVRGEYFTHSLITLLWF